jgi:hypothetical protein
MWMFFVMTIHHHDTSLQDSSVSREALSTLPGMCSFFWSSTLCIWPKDWSFLLQLSPRKVHFCVHDWWRLYLLCWFKHNNGYLCLWQGLLVLFETWWWMSAILLKMHRLGKKIVKSCVVKWVIYIRHVAMDMNTFYDAKWPLLYY